MDEFEELITKHFRDSLNDTWNKGFTSGVTSSVSAIRAFSEELYNMGLITPLVASSLDTLAMSLEATAEGLVNEKT